MYYSLTHWCENRGTWCRIEGLEWDSLPPAIAMANHYAATTGKVIRVVDWDEQIHYQTGNC